ncbi:MAG: hypothetical protein K6F33_04895 [Bacteroidales bacterium]|nr:hypothetical protein [Bacteroidales bacterium]
MEISKIVVNKQYTLEGKFQYFLEHLPSIFENAGAILHSGRNVVKVYCPMECGLLHSVVVKKYKVPNLLQRIYYTLVGKSKCMKAYGNGLILEKRGFSTPESVAAVELKKHGLFYTGYYICKEESNMVPLSDLIMQNGTVNTPIANGFAQLLVKLHCNGLVFNDLNLNNVLCSTNEDGSSNYTLIDTNRMKIYDATNLPLKNCLNDFTTFTGGFNAFSYVIDKYCELRKLNEHFETDKLMIIKAVHNINYHRKKKFLHGLKNLLT